MQKIKRVVGQEPMRENEYPSAFWVGHPAYQGGEAVAHVEVVEDNLGTYGIKWFVAYDKDMRRLGQINAVHTMEVEYFPEKPDA